MHNTPGKGVRNAARRSERSGHRQCVTRCRMDKLGVGDLVVSNLGYLRIDTINHTATSTVSVRATGLSDGRSYVMLDVRRTARVSVIPRAHAHQINPIGHIVH